MAGVPKVSRILAGKSTSQRTSSGTTEKLMTIYIVDIEAVDTRYTKQWKEYLPDQLRQATMKDVVVISGGDTPQATTPGAFLNFGGTNVYKSKQLEQIGEMFCNGEIKNGDYFLYTDAWNPTVIQLRYMAELLGVDVTIGGLWHAGSYDPQDFLGRIIGDAEWVRLTEAAMFEVYDHNYYATSFHIDLFAQAFAHEVFKTAWVSENLNSGKLVRTGWPMEYLQNSLDDYKGQEKENLILFPHRLAPEKQVEIFKDLAEQLPEYEFVVCQEQELTKDEYHSLLARAKVVFSANLQETLGISWYEGALVGALPMVPNRLSYAEMADQCFKYPSSWTEDFDSYLANRDQVVSQLVNYVENYDTYVSKVEEQVEYLNDLFFNGETLYGKLR